MLSDISWKFNKHVKNFDKFLGNLRDYRDVTKVVAEIWPGTARPGSNKTVDDSPKPVTKMQQIATGSKGGHPRYTPGVDTPRGPQNLRNTGFFTCFDHLP